MRAARAARIGARAGRLSRVGVPQDVSMEWPKDMAKFGKVFQIAVGPRICWPLSSLSSLGSDENSAC